MFIIFEIVISLEMFWHSIKAAINMFFVSDELYHRRCQLPFTTPFAIKQHTHLGKY